MEDGVTPEQELLWAIYIQTTRILDVLYITAAALGADAEQLKQLHTDGKIISPEVWLDVS